MTETVIRNRLQDATPDELRECDGVNRCIPSEVSLNDFGLPFRQAELNRATHRQAGGWRTIRVHLGNGVCGVFVWCVCGFSVHHFESHRRELRRHLRGLPTARLARVGQVADSGVGGGNDT